MRPKHTRKQRSFDALNAEITQPITPGVAQNGYGPPSEVKERKKERKKEEERKKNEILAKNADTTQKHITAVKHWYPPSFCCSALPDLRLVLFPEMSVSQPFPKGFGDFHANLEVLYVF